MNYPRVVDGFLVRSAGGKGYGIFAQRRYKRGERIVQVRGARIKDTDPRLTHRGVQVGQHVFVEPARFSPIWYLNHSCEPNAYFDMDALIARRDIAAGEEITADYSLFTDFPTWDMECACGAAACRRLIVPFSKLPRRPTRFVSSYLQ
jgi:SET domain-containing protein